MSGRRALNLVNGVSKGGVLQLDHGARGGDWASRPVLAYLLIAVAYLLPATAALVAVGALEMIFPRPSSAGAVAGEWIAMVIVAAGTVFLLERASRRLLPLAALLRLSLTFPDRAPARLAVAWRAGSIRRLTAAVDQATREGRNDTPSLAAARIVELVGALHAHDRRTRGHSERVRALTDLLAAELHLSEPDRERLRWSALLHDIGKLAVPAHVLNKPGRPDSEEWAVIVAHPREGARLAAPLQGWLGPWAAVIEQHHERFDGGGYPAGLAGQEISLGARIVGLTDAFEVMTSTRAYKRSMTVASARSELVRHAGAQFDPAMVRAFLGISLPRLRAAVGPAAFLAEAPLFGWRPRLAAYIAHPGALLGVTALSLGLGFGPASMPSEANGSPSQQSPVETVNATPGSGLLAQSTPSAAPAAGPSEPFTHGPFKPWPIAPIASPPQPTTSALVAAPSAPTRAAPAPVSSPQPPSAPPRTSRPGNPSPSPTQASSGQASPGQPSPGQASSGQATKSGSTDECMGLTAPWRWGQLKQQTGNTGPARPAECRP